MWLFAREETSRKGGAPLGLVVIVLLVLAWAVVLGPAFLRPRFEASPEAGIRNFERTLGILASTRHGQQVPGRWVMVPKDLPQAPRRRRNRVIRRRRQTFTRLLGAAAVTLILGLFPGLHALLWAHVAVDAAVIGYVVYLRRLRAREAERQRVVRELPIDAAEPAQRDAAVRPG